MIFTQGAPLMQKWYSWRSCMQSNWNLEMLSFEERGKPDHLGKNLSDQGKEPTKPHMAMRLKSNAGHISEKRVQSHLRHLYSPNLWPKWSYLIPKFVVWLNSLMLCLKVLTSIACKKAYFGAGHLWCWCTCYPSKIVWYKPGDDKILKQYWLRGLTLLIYSN